MSIPTPTPPRTRRRWGALVAAVAVLLATAVSPLPAFADHRPSRIDLPDGFAPEDITAGPGHTFFVGSLATGAIWKGSFRTGEGRVLVRSATGPTTGLFLERRHGHDRLWAAGGPSGQARVYDASDGTLLRTYQVSAPASGTFVSDVVVTHHAAYYTDAFLPQLFVLPFGDHGSRHLPGRDDVRTVPLTGDVHYVTGPNSFNLNGLAAVDRWLVSAQTVTGRFFRIDPRSGATREIPVTDRAGDPVTVAGADGIAQRGRTLYVAQNFPQKLATVRLSEHLRRARLLETVGDPALDIPSSVERDGGDLYGLNARFTTPRTPTTPYAVVRVDG
jgi:hypothetical protein